MEKPYQVIEVNDNRHYKRLAELFREYESYLGFELSFQNFEKELNNLTKMYRPPTGKAFLLMDRSGIFFGCIAVRQLEENIGEIKRMYLKPEWRGEGYGKVLMDIALQATRNLGYKKVRLDTLDTMTAAIAIYKKAGFYEIPQYRENPFENAVFMEKELRRE